jgi:outer membrane protein assembly factor BamB
MSTNVAAGMRAALLAAALFGLPTAASDRTDSGEAVERLGSRRGGEDWPAFLGSRGDARSQERPLTTDWPEGGLPLVWQRQIGEGYSMPSVAHGRLFLFDRHGDRARLTCLNSETGEEIWRAEYDTHYVDAFQFSNGPRASPVVDGPRVYTLGAAGRLRCHGVTDGELIWDVDTTEKFGVVQNFFGVGSTPVVHGDLLIAMIGGSPPDSPKIDSGDVRGNGSGIVAFDKYTGEVRYAVTDELASYSTPVIVSTEHVSRGFAFARGGLVVFEPGTGEVQFEFPWRAKKMYSVNASNPVVVENTVFVTEGYGPGSALLRFGIDGYDVVWSDAKGDERLLSHWATPVYHEGFIYGCHGQGSGEAELRAIDYRTGEVAWSQPGLGRVTLLYVDGHLLVWSEYGKLQLIEANPRKLEIKAEMDLGRRAADSAPFVEQPAWNAPILSQGLLYLRGKRQLLCFELISAPRLGESKKHQ